MAERAQCEDQRTRSIYRTGAVVSVIQSLLFIVIALCALGLGIDRFVSGSFEGLYAASPRLFITLCLGFVAIALLGLAITPAEKRLFERDDAGLVSWGSSLAYLGHMGTIAFFSWWVFFVTMDRTGHPPIAADLLMPIRWGVMFELVFVGAWVWIIASVLWARARFPRGFLIVTICKGVSFWFAFIAFLVNSKVLLLLGVGLVAGVFGPLWHFWIATVFNRHLGQVGELEVSRSAAASGGELRP